MKKKQTGLTLVELMVTLAVFAIAASIAVPAFQNITRSNRMAATINALSRDISLARSEALKRGQNVAICSSSSGANCTNDGNWNVGWIVAATAGPMPGSAINAIIRVQDPVQGGYNLTPTGPFPDPTTINFRGDGTVRPLGGAVVAATGAFVLCDTLGDGNQNFRGRGLDLSPLGRVSVLIDEDADRIVNLSGGVNINCP